MSHHFQDEDALSHIVEKRAEGILSLSESHGTETPGHLSAAADAARETGLVLLLLWLMFRLFGAGVGPTLIAFASFGMGWLVWKTGRSAWLGWSRLERLHRLIEQEKYEIEHHRPQEREELVALYTAKGFEGKLLVDVVDVLMADQDRLLKVMLEEELGLTLMAYEHPLKQSAGALTSSLVALVLSWTLVFFFPLYGMPIASILLISGGALLSAIYEKNRLIPALIWALSIGAFAFGTAYFVFKMLISA